MSGKVFLTQILFEFWAEMIYILELLPWADWNLFPGRNVHFGIFFPSILGRNLFRLGKDQKVYFKSDFFPDKPLGKEKSWKRISSPKTTPLKDQQEKKQNDEFLAGSKIWR